jgi:hypothetical protein
MTAEMSIRSRLLLIVLLATAFPVLLVLARFLQERDAAMASDTASLAAVAHSRATLLNEKIQHGPDPLDEKVPVSSLPDTFKDLFRRQARA